MVSPLSSPAGSVSGKLIRLFEDLNRSKEKNVERVGEKKVVEGEIVVGFDGIADGEEDEGNDTFAEFLERRREGGELEMEF